MSYHPGLGRLLFGIVLAFGAALACASEGSSSGNSNTNFLHCTSSSNCAEGEICLDGTCVVASVRDAGRGTGGAGGRSEGGVSSCTMASKADNCGDCPPTWNDAVALCAVGVSGNVYLVHDLSRCGDYLTINLWGADTGQVFFYDASTGDLVGRVFSMPMSSFCFAYTPSFALPSTPLGDLCHTVSSCGPGSGGTGTGGTSPGTGGAGGVSTGGTSSGGTNPGTGGAETGGAGTGGANDAGASFSPVSCDGTCPLGTYCMELQPLGGGSLYHPNDAGVCPPGFRVLPESTPDSCWADPTYRCFPIPTTCGNPPDCNCSATLCQGASFGSVCTAASATHFRCLEHLP